VKVEGNSLVFVRTEGALDQFTTPVIVPLGQGGPAEIFGQAFGLDIYFLQIIRNEGPNQWRLLCVWSLDRGATWQVGPSQTYDPTIPVLVGVWWGLPNAYGAPPLANGRVFFYRHVDDSDEVELVYSDDFGSSFHSIITTPTGRITVVTNGARQVAVAYGTQTDIGILPACPDDPASRPYTYSRVDVTLLSSTDSGNSFRSFGYVPHVETAYLEDSVGIAGLAIVPSGKIVLAVTDSTSDFESCCFLERASWQAREYLIQPSAQSYPTPQMVFHQGTRDSNCQGVEQTFSDAGILSGPSLHSVSERGTRFYWGRVPNTTQTTILGFPTGTTFSKEIRTKMYIGPIGSCDPIGVLGYPTSPLGLARQIAYMTFCKATDRFFGENPPTGEQSTPLNARVLSIVRFIWECQPNRSLPVAIQITPVASIGGPEPFGLVGLASPIAAVNQVLVDGTWSFVASGRPAPASEPSFQVHRPRFNFYIWHRVAGSIACGTDGTGAATSSITTRFTNATRFPSHRSYFHDVNGAFLKQNETILQHQFSNLWFLPATMAPFSYEKGNAESINASLSGCSYNIPLPPDPFPPDFDWTPLAIDWCAQLAACGYPTLDCVDSYVANVNNPITEPVLPPPDESTLSSSIDSLELSCTDSDEYLAGQIACGCMTPLTWLGKNELAWPVLPNTTSYRVYQGSLATLPNLLNGSVDSCIRYEGSATSTGPILAEIPPVSDLAWYLVVGLEGSVAGSACFSSSGERSVNASDTCP